jgi:mono/diheme cytochrome c family protein
MICSGSRIAALLLVGAPALLAQQNPHGSLASDVSAIFQEKCAQCHGEAQQMAGLDLRTREDLLKGGQSGPAIVPGDASASALYLRLTGAKQPAMPLGAPLAPEQIETVRKWIESGADWGSGGTDPAAAPKALDGKREITEADRQWWAFQKPVRHAVPEVADKRWNGNPIDAFVEAKRNEKGLTAAPRADKRTLIRRAYLDLLGLLPSPEEVEAFAADDSSRAFSNLVDTLLESPHYGERWARHWLDIARYADSKGYEQDYDNPDAWRYRDYVIRAFNQDKPYDRFLVEQLAGDELDDGDFDSVTALGFHRVGPRVAFREKDNPEYRYTYLDDMIGTTSRAFMGLTVNCARCHDHKFDPILQMGNGNIHAVSA